VPSAAACTKCHDKLRRWCQVDGFWVDGGAIGYTQVVLQNIVNLFSKLTYFPRGLEKLFIMRCEKASPQTIPTLALAECCVGLGAEGFEVNPGESFGGADPKFVACVGGEG
jgi:hypothetical protein